MFARNQASIRVKLCANCLKLVLLVFATRNWAAAVDHRVDLSATCTAGKYRQPDGDFAVNVYCDDGLGVNINIELSRFYAPVAGAFKPSARIWQGGPWAASVTGFIWDGAERLYTATEAYNGSGKVYRLHLIKQEATEIWRVGPGDCAPVITGLDNNGLQLKVSACDGTGARSEWLNDRADAQE